MAIVILTLQCLADSAQAGIIRVPEDQPSIAAGLAAASYGDSLDIAVGTYYEHDLSLPLGVSIIGRGTNPELVVIDAQFQGRVVAGEELDGQTVLANFTAKHGDSQGYYGSGLKLVGPCSMHDLIIEDNYFSEGGSAVGAYCFHVALIEDCIFRNNYSPHPNSTGGGLWVEPRNGTVIRRVDFLGNGAGRGGGLYVNGEKGAVLESIRVINTKLGSGIWVYEGEFGFWGGVLLENSVIANNAGIGIVGIANMTIRNCTIVGCTSGIRAAATWDRPKWITVENCIVAYNEAGSYGGGFIFDDEPMFTIECTNAFGNLPYNYSWTPDPTGTNGNISVDPNICDDAMPNEFPLGSDSPCLPENNSCGMLMGAFDKGCTGTVSRTTSWSRVKGLY